MAMKQVSFRVEEEFMQKFSQKCVEEDIPQSEVFRALLELYANGEIKFERKLVVTTKLVK